MNNKNIKIERPEEVVTNKRDYNYKDFLKYNKDKNNVRDKENIIHRPAQEATVNANPQKQNLIFKEYQKELLKKMNRANSFEKVKQVTHHNQSYDFKYKPVDQEVPTAVLNSSNIETKAIKVRKKFTRENRSIHSLNSSSLENLEIPKEVTDQWYRNNNQAQRPANANPSKPQANYRIMSPEKGIEDPLHMRNHPSTSVIATKAVPSAKAKYSYPLSKSIKTDSSNYSSKPIVYKQIKTEVKEEKLEDIPLKIENIPSQGKTLNMDYFRSKSFEVELLLKNKPKSIKHISNYYHNILKGYKFILKMEGYASRMQVRKGLLSRWLLPFDDDTSCNDQSEAHVVHGKTIRIQEHLPDFEDPRQQRMINELEKDKDALLKLRATIRIKIADDNDLNQAKTVCLDILTFFSDLSRHSSTVGADIVNSIKDCFAL